MFKILKFRKLEFVSDFGFRISSLILLFILPLSVYADGVNELIDSASGIVTSVLIPLAFALCLLLFFWGVVKYIGKGAASEEAAKEGKRIMVWGLIGIFVAFSVWGIITFIQSELGILPIEKAAISNY